MLKPEVVVFDLGKVLVDFDYSIAARNIAAHANLAASRIQPLIESSPLLVRYETGLINTEEFYMQVCAQTGFRGDLGNFRPLFGNIFFPIEPMLELHAQLLERQIPTFIFSNTNEIAVQYIRGKFPFFGNFQSYVFSYEHGAMKPDSKLYEVVENVTQRAAEKILYLDDRLENAQAGIERGWQVIHHQKPQETIAAFQRLGLLPA